MPGYIIHLSAAEEVWPLLEQKLFPDDPDARNAFFVSCLIPDAVSDKRTTHYRHTDDKEIQIRYPEPWRFINAYRDIMHTPQAMGFLFHLYTDYLFYHEYWGRHILLCDRDFRPQIRKNMIEQTVLLDFDNRILPGLDFFRQKYMYSDYTIFNAVLEDKYHLTYDFAPVENPGIKEVDYAAIEEIRNDILSYSAESRSLTNHETKYLKTEFLLQFIEDCAVRFMQDYPFWMR